MLLFRRRLRFRPLKNDLISGLSAGLSPGFGVAFGGFFPTSTVRKWCLRPRHPNALVPFKCHLGGKLSKEGHTVIPAGLGWNSITSTIKLNGKYFLEKVTFETTRTRQQRHIYRKFKQAFQLANNGANKIAQVRKGGRGGHLENPYWEGVQATLSEVVVTLHFSRASRPSVLVSLWLRTVTLFSDWDTFCWVWSFAVGESLPMPWTLLLLFAAAVVEFLRMICCDIFWCRSWNVSFVGDLMSKTEQSDSTSESICKVYAIGLAYLATSSYNNCTALLIPC